MQDGSYLGFLIEIILVIFSVFNIHVTPILPTKFRVNWPFGSEEKNKNRIDFQDCNILGFPIGPCFAIFDRQVTLMLPTKFCVNLSFHLGVEVANTFPKWRRWRPCWISDGKDFSYFLSTSHTDSSYQVSSNWLFGSGEEIQNRFSNGGHGGHLGFQIGMTLVIFFYRSL